MPVKTPDKLIQSLQEKAKLLRASREFPYFLENYVYILEPPPGGATIRFEMWDHLREACGLLGTERLISWLKARQIGASWLIASWVLWNALYVEATRVGLFSKGETEAKELLDKAKFIYDHLPGTLRRPVSGWNMEKASFTRTYATIQSFPSTPSAGRSWTFSIVVFDEADFHEYLSDDYGAVKPTVDDVGGQVILLSTSNPTKAISTFKTIHKAARLGTNGFKAVFYGWNVRPNRDEEWYANRRAEAEDEAKFEKDYPGSEGEALAPSQALMAFDKNALLAMELDCRDAVETVGLFRVYQKFQVGKRYGAGTDTSHGVGKDDAVTVILDLDTGVTVADLQSNVISPEELAYQSVEMLGQYGNPLWGIEDNEWGIVTLRTAQALNYPRLYFRDEVTTVKVSGGEAKPIKKWGWHTDERSRYMLWGDLISAVKSRLMTIFSKDGLSQFFTVIRNPEKSGRIEGQEGAHDDYPMAAGIAWQMRKHVTVATRRVGGVGAVQVAAKW